MNRALLTALLLGAVAPSTALACGGFFCSSQPIDQSKERIVFAIDEETDKVDVHVQIFYQGSASEFAWVVPVPTVPALATSTDIMFQMLEQVTDPQFYLEYREIGTCDYEGRYWYGTDDAAEADGGGLPPNAGAGGGGVTVVAQAQVGPYETATLQADSTEALLTWLNDNDYVIPASFGKALEPYVTDGAYLVALRLQNDKDAGDIEPLRMTYDASAAMIPLVLTSIAATPDMRLQPYIFSNGKRAVPDNYLHVQVNEAAINWLNGGSNYDAVITRAANEAGGQAFATDYAGSTQNFRGMLYREGQYDLASLRAQTNPAQFVGAMLGMGFPRTTQVQNLIRAYIAMPQAARDAGVDESSYYNCLDCYPEYVAMIDFDPEAFTDALDAKIVTPLREANELFEDFSYVTRLTSSMSPDEMDLDPFFTLNADMGDVSNLHQADLVVDCTVEPKYAEAPRYVELNDGRQIAVPSEQWFYDSAVAGGTPWESWNADLDVPAALVIEQTSATGLPTTVIDQGSESEAGLDAHNLRWGRLIGFPSDEPTVTTACGGCNGGASGAGWAALGALALLRRRRA